MHEVNVDLTNCDREPIHIIGRVQSFGFLIGVSPDWIITHASRNVRDAAGQDAELLIGVPAGEILNPEAIHTLRSRLQMLASDMSVERVFSLALFGGEQLYDVALHMSGRTIVIEAEQTCERGLLHYINYVRPMSDRVKQGTTTTEMCEIAARQLRALTGFDRVMVYRFAPDLSGEVVAESRKAGIDSFLGLHFPSSDIPAQARRLYGQNLLRIISDVDDPTVAIVPALNPDGLPLDLTMSTLRAVSPIHIEYLRNMGVQASLSVSIMRQGKLWGLFACHHYAPLQLPYPVRTAAELFGELFAYMLDQSENRHASERNEAAARLHDQLMVGLAEGASLLSNFEGFSETISKVIQHDGIAGWVDGQFMSSGLAPSKEEFVALARFLNTTTAGSIWSTDNLAAKFPAARDFGKKVAGLLAIPVSRTPRDYIVLFRDEITNSVRWAGNPEKAITLGPNGARLTPRKSFEEWKQVVTDHSRQWTEEEHHSAEQLRITMIEVILRVTDAANRERKEAGKRQEILIAELNHRVRNILNLIRSLIGQTQPASGSIQEYAQILGSRIYALARAHDLLTKSDWTATALRSVIAIEAKAYLQGDADRLQVIGVGAVIRPSALTTLSLVFHELITNSCKYGALSSREGQVKLELSRGPNGDLRITWLEMGGPEVAEPKRRGFGSTIIERSIPHELGGAARIEYRKQGVIAHFTVPASFIVHYTEPQEPAEDSIDSSDVTVVGRGLPDTILLVEDNILIAMEAEEMLTDLGARTVKIAGNVADALGLIGETRFGLALLDVNLGIETSAPIARELSAQGVPFALATGFGDDIVDKEAFGTAPVLTKPYSRDDLASVLNKLPHKD